MPALATEPAATASTIKSFQGHHESFNPLRKLVVEAETLKKPSPISLDRSSWQLLTRSLGSFFSFSSRLGAALRTVVACTMARCARAAPLTSTALADSLVGSLHWLCLNISNITLCAPSTVAMTWSTATNTLLPTALADGLVGSWHRLWFVCLTSLQVRQPPRLVVDISDLLVSLHVEGSESLAGGCTQRSLEVRVKTTQSTHGLVAHTILAVHRPGSVSCLVLLVEAAKHIGEPLADTVLLV